MSTCLKNKTGLVHPKVDQNRFIIAKCLVKVTDSHHRNNISLRITNIITATKIKKGITISDLQSVKSLRNYKSR